MKSESGVALLMVLLVVSLLTAVIVDFSYRTRLDARIAANVRDDLKAENLTRSAFETSLAVLNRDTLTPDKPASTGAAGAADAAVSDLLNQARREAGGTPGGAPSANVDSFRDAWAHMENLKIPLQPGESLQVQVSDLSGRIDLNAIITKDQTGAEKLSQPVFEQLVTLIENARRAVGEHEKSSDESLSPEEIAYAIADWVDSDEIRIADGGFEDQYYNSLADPYSSKNGPFDSVAEVQLVAGIDDRLYAAIKDALTVYPFTGGGAINPNTAPPVVLASLRVRENAAIEAREPLTGEQIATILAARRDGTVLRSDQELKELLDLDAAAVFSPALVYGSSYFAVDATAVVNGTVSRLHAVVDRAGQKPEILYWRVD